MANQVSLEEIQEKLEEIFDGYSYDWEGFLLGDCDSSISDRVQWLEQDGGFEGGAEECHTIFSIDGVFYRAEYSYGSYAGFYTDDADVYEVTPVQRMTTYYE